MYAQYIVSPLVYTTEFAKYTEVGKSLLTPKCLKAFRFRGGGLRRPDLPPEALPPGSPLGAPPHTPIIGSRSRARQVPLPTICPALPLCLG